MTTREQRAVVARLERVADPQPGLDWLDVRRRARRQRSRGLALIAAAVAALAVAIPASGLGVRLVDWIPVPGGSSVVPSSRAAPAPVFLYGNALYRGEERVGQIATALLAPLLGNQAPLVVGSPDGRRFVYHAWDGSLRGAGAPTLRLYDRRTGRDRVLARGAQSVAWNRDGRLAYMVAAKPVYRPSPPHGVPGGYYGHVVVRTSLREAAVPWTSGAPGIYEALAWAGKTLLVSSHGSNLPVAKPVLPPGIYGFTGPRRSRRLPISELVAISPDGRRVVGTSRPAHEGAGSPDLRIVRIRDRHVVATLRGAEIARAVRTESRPTIGPWGTWAGQRVVAPLAGGKLIVLRVTRSIRVERVVAVELAVRPREYHGPWLYAPVFVDARGRDVVARADVASPDESTGFSVFLTCDVTASTCEGGRRLVPPTRWAAIVQNPSRPR